MTIETVVYATSNNQAGDFRRALLGLTTRRGKGLAQLIALKGGGQFATVDRIDLNIPLNAQLSGREKCSSHYDCLNGYFCASWGTCDLCGFCEVDAWDAVDGRCPIDTCPNSGGFPHCVDAQKLSDIIKPCNNQYDFEVWKFTEQMHNPETGMLEHVAPQVIPQSESKPRYVTPQNRMVGAFVITQVSSLVQALLFCPLRILCQAFVMNHGRSCYRSQRIGEGQRRHMLYCTKSCLCAFVGRFAGHLALATWGVHP